jgi:deoxycytidylate deaminase
MLLTHGTDLDRSILKLARTWAADMSHDPDTKVGAAVYDPVTNGMHFGINGFPKKVHEGPARWAKPAKYDFVIHAEVNAIIKALQSLGSDVSRCTLYCTHKPCSKCAGMAIQVGIKNIVYVDTHWDDQLTDQICDETNTRLVKLTGPICSEEADKDIKAVWAGIAQVKLTKITETCYGPPIPAEMLLRKIGPTSGSW